MIGKLLPSLQNWVGERLGAARLSARPEINFAKRKEDMKGEFGFVITVAFWLVSALPFTMLKVSGDWFFAFCWLLAVLFTFMARCRQRFFEQHLGPPKLAHIISRRR